MKLEWYWQLIVRFALLAPIMMGVHIIGLALGWLSPWAQWEYFAWPFMLASAMTWYARREGER